jgi:hypothetical protein
MKQARPIIMPVYLSLNSPKATSSITVISKAKVFIPVMEILYKLPNFNLYIGIRLHSSVSDSSILSAIVMETRLFTWDDVLSSACSPFGSGCPFLYISLAFDVCIFRTLEG